MKNRRSWLKNCIVLFVAFLLFAYTSDPSYAGEEENIKTIDDYLKDEDNIFSNDLKARKEQVESITETIESLEKLSFLFVKTAERDALYKNVGEEVFIPKESYGYEVLKGYASGNSGMYLTSEGLTIKKDGEVWGSTTVKINSFQDTLTKTKEDLEEKYGKLNKLYSGFCVVGSTNGTTFQTNITHNPAFDGWGGTKDYLYGTGEVSDSDAKEETKAGFVEKLIAEPLGNGATSLYLWMYDWNIDLTIDGLIYGRMAGNFKGGADFTHFGLEENNPYGIVAASAYYVLRRIILSVLPVILMAFFIRQLFQNTQRGRAELKAMLTSMLFVIAFLFIAPYVINIVIFVRDGVLKYTSLGMAGILKSVGLTDGVGGSIVGVTYGMYENNHTLLNAIIWCASVGSGFVFMTTYIKIAVLLCGAVSVLPLVLCITLWNKRIFQDWWNVFFPNLFVPFVDLVLLQIPSVVLLIFKKHGGSGGGVVLSIILIVIIWNTMLIRDRIIRLLGFEGLGRNGGGALAAVMMLMRAAKAGRSHKIGESKGNEERVSAKEGEMVEGAKHTAMETIRGSIGEMDTNRSLFYDPNLSQDTDTYLRSLEERSPYGFKEHDISENESFASESLRESIPEENAVSYSALRDSEEGSYSFTYKETPEDFVTSEEFLPTLSDETKNFAQSDALNARIDTYESKAFLDSLADDGDKNRYKNLLQMDYLNETIDKNESYLQRLGFESPQKAHAEMEKNFEQIDQINTHMEQTKERINSGEEKVSEEIKKDAFTLRELETTKERLLTRNQQISQAFTLNRETQYLKAELDKRTESENTYARASRVGGLEERVYTSSKEFEARVRLDQVKRSFATYENFESKRYESILSPAEKERFYRERAVKESKDRYIKVAKNAADMGLHVASSVAALGVGATLSYAGPGVSATAGLATYSAGRSIKGGAESSSKYVTDALHQNLDGKNSRTNQPPKDTKPVNYGLYEHTRTNAEKDGKGFATNSKSLSKKANAEERTVEKTQKKPEKDFSKKFSARAGDEEKRNDIKASYLAKKASKTINWKED